MARRSFVLTETAKLLVAASLAFVGVCGAQTIPNLPAASSIASSDLIIVSQGGVTKRATAGQMATGATGTAPGLTAGNSSQLLGSTWAAPAAIGSTTPNAVASNQVTITRGGASLTGVLNTSQSLTGTITSANYCGPNTNITQLPAINCIVSTGDNVNASLGGNGNDLDLIQINNTIGGSSMQGARQTLDVTTFFNAPTSASNPNRYYGSIVGGTFCNSGDGGTSTVVGAGALGNCFGMNDVVYATSAATNLTSIVANEADVHCVGCTTAVRFGKEVVSWPTTQAANLSQDGAYAIGEAGGSGAVGWHNGLLLTNFNGPNPLDTGGCVICTDGSVDAIATGMDLSSYTISGNFLKGPAGLFTVTGGGGTATTSLTINDPATSGNALTVNATSDTAAGASILLAGNGGANPSKTVRAFGGNYQIVNNANSGAILTLTDGGDLSTTGGLDGTVIGANTPAAITGTTVNATTSINLSTAATSPVLLMTAPTGSYQNSIAFNRASTSKWQIGMQSDNSWFFYDAADGVTAMTVTAAGATTLGESGKTLNLVGTPLQANGTAGVTCSGAPTASFATTNGIVTHC